MITRCQTLLRGRHVEVTEMAYPEPIPAITAKRDAKNFEKRLDDFKLTSAQKDFYKQARGRFKPLSDK